MGAEEFQKTLSRARRVAQVCRFLAISDKHLTNLKYSRTFPHKEKVRIKTTKIVYYQQGEIPSAPKYLIHPICQGEKSTKLDKKICKKGQFLLFMEMHETQDIGNKPLTKHNM